MTWNHKGRLSLVSAAATGLLLALVFVSVVTVAQQVTLNQNESELKSALTALTGDPHHLEIDEFEESHADMSLTVFDSQGHPVIQYGSFRLPPAQGFRKDKEWLSMGVKRSGQLVVIGSDWKQVSRGLERLAIVLALLWLPLTVLAGAVSWFAARSVFRPLERLSEQASMMGRTMQIERLSTSDSAEFGIFVQHLNQMLSRIEETVQHEDQFASDAAHELRTPLAILRTRIETTLLNERTTSEYVESNKAMLGELDRLTRIVEALLRTAKRAPDIASPIDLEPVVLGCIARWQEQFVAADVFLATESAPVLAAITREELVVILDNLLDNALRFSTSGSTVSVCLRASEDLALLSVEDEGPGIPIDLGDKVFDRFVRSDDSRNRASGGSGIGLAVCKKILTARGGTISIGAMSDTGTTINVTLPIATMDR